MSSFERRMIEVVGPPKMLDDLEGIVRNVGSIMGVEVVVQDTGPFVAEATEQVTIEAGAGLYSVYPDPTSESGEVRVVEKMHLRTFEESNIGVKGRSERAWNALKRVHDKSVSNRINDHGEPESIWWYGANRDDEAEPIGLKATMIHLVPNENAFSMIQGVGGVALEFMQDFADAFKSSDNDG